MHIKEMKKMIYDFFDSFGGLNTMSDNYVTGDNIYLRELQNFFFQTLGMMSITHYGAIGDGRRDNYGPLQVAIDDANRRGLSYLYVPYGKFIYTGELINKENVIFVGNPKAHIVNIRTGEEIPIEQFGLNTTSNYYTKNEVQALLSYKQDKSSMSDYYSKSEVDALLANCYTKDEADALLASKQNTLIAGEGITIDNDVISVTASIEGNPFSSCPFPTSWSGTDTDMTGSNTYGTWEITTTATPASGTSLGNAFDGNNSTRFEPHIGASWGGEVEIDLPNGVSIRPTQLYLRAGWDNGQSSFCGYSEQASSWRTLATFNGNGGLNIVRTIEEGIDTVEYFTKFKMTKVNQVGDKEGLYEFQITEGYIKDEN